MMAAMAVMQAATNNAGKNPTPACTRAAVLRPPTPTNANCPSESWPAHPVSTVSDRATMA